MDKERVEIRYTDLSDGCKGFHRFFAIEELISNESTKMSQLVLACTQCGAIVIHKIQAI
jgi:ribosomal protein L44E